MVLSEWMYQISKEISHYRQECDEPVKLEIDHGKKLVSVRLTQAESGDRAVQAQLRALCPACWQRRYTVAVYHASPGLLPSRGPAHGAPGLSQGVRSLSGNMVSKNNLAVFGNIHPENGR